MHDRHLIAFSNPYIFASHILPNLLLLPFEQLGTFDIFLSNYYLSDVLLKQMLDKIDKAQHISIYIVPSYQNIFSTTNVQRRSYFLEWQFLRRYANLDLQYRTISLHSSNSSFDYWFIKKTKNSARKILIIPTLLRESDSGTFFNFNKIKHIRLKSTLKLSLKLASTFCAAVSEFFFASFYMHRVIAKAFNRNKEYGTQYLPNVIIGGGDIEKISSHFNSCGAKITPCDFSLQTGIAKNSDELLFLLTNIDYSNDEEYLLYLLRCSELALEYSKCTTLLIRMHPRGSAVFFDNFCSLLLKNKISFRVESDHLLTDQLNSHKFILSELSSAGILAAEMPNKVILGLNYDSFRRGEKVTWLGQIYRGVETKYYLELQILNTMQSGRLNFLDAFVSEIGKL